MKTLNDDTIKQLGNGIIDEIRRNYNAYFEGYYDTATEGVEFRNTLYNRIGKFVVHVGDCIIVNHQRITEPVYYTGTFTINFDTNTPYTVFTVIDVNIKAESSIYIDALDKAGNKVSINSTNGSTFFIRLKEPIIPITWNHTTWKSNNRIQSLVLDSNFLKFKEGDKIKFGSAENETFFNNTTVEIKEITISKYTDNTHFYAIFTLSNDFKNSEVVDMRCSVVLNGNTYTEKQRRITTNCPTYILGTVKDDDVASCTSIVLPKGNITIDAELYSKYLPKVGDVVCAYDSPNITDLGLYLANIEYIQTMDTPTPYAILGVAGVTFAKYYIVNGAFVTVVNTGGSGSSNN